jgi:hypothetical protein
MSKRHRAHIARRRNLALPIIIFGGVLLILAVFLLTRQGDGGGTPEIVVDQQKIDFGYVKFGETRSIKIAVTNTGDGVLRFTKKPYIEVLEGC